MPGRGPAAADIVRGQVRRVQSVGWGLDTDRLVVDRARPQRAETSMRRVASGSAVNLVGALVSGVCAFAVTVAVTRGLSQETAGVFFAATSVFLLVSTLSQLGTATGLVYFISRARAQGEPGLIHHYLRAGLRPVLIVSAVAGAVLLVVAPLIARVTTPGHVHATETYLRVLAVFVPLAALENGWLSATRGMGTMRPSAFVEQIARPVVQLGLVALAVVAGFPGLGTAWVVGYLPAMVLAWMWWRRTFRRLPVDAPAATLPAAPLFREFWRFTLPRAGTSLVQVLMQRFDIVLVAALAGVRDAAIYAAATRFVVAGQIGTSAIGRAAQPQLGHSIALDDHDATNHIYQTSTAWLMLVTWPIFLLFIGFQDTLLSVFGKGYAAGAVVMVLISLSMLVATGFGMVDMVLAMAGRTTWNLANASFALAVNLGLDLWLVPRHGVLGAAIGWSVAIVAQNVLALTQVGVVLRLHPFGRTTTAAGLLALSCFLALPMALRWALGQNVTTLVIAGVVGSACYLAGGWRLRSVLRLDSLRRPRRRPGAGRAGPTARIEGEATAS